MFLILLKIYCQFKNSPLIICICGISYLLLFGEEPSDRVDPSQGAT